MKEQAFFISSNGKIIPVYETHIDMIIDNPEKFNLTNDYIEEIYKKYNEKLRTENKARDEIFINLLKKGWIRLRRYSLFWSIQLYELTRKNKDYLFDFANKGIDGTSPFKKRIGISEKMKISSIKDKKTWEFIFKDISNDILYTDIIEAGIPKVKRYKLEFCTIENYKPLKTFNNYLENE